MQLCKTCTKAIFNPIWGEYKCSVTKKKVETKTYGRCKDYAKGETQISKKEREE